MNSMIDRSERIIQYNISVKSMTSSNNIVLSQSIILRDNISFYDYVLLHKMLLYQHALSISISINIVTIQYGEKRITVK